MLSQDNLHLLAHTHWLWLNHEDLTSLLLWLADLELRNWVYDLLGRSTRPLRIAVCRGQQVHPTSHIRSIARHEECCAINCTLRGLVELVTRDL